jgi:hypothetical protein
MRFREHLSYDEKENDDPQKQYQQRVKKAYNPSKARYAQTGATAKAAGI